MRNNCFQCLAMVSETLLAYDGFAEYLVLEAVDRDDRVLGRSAVVKTMPPASPNHPVVLGAKIAKQEGWEHAAVKPTSAFDSPVLIYLMGVLSCASVGGLMCWAMWRFRSRAAGMEWRAPARSRGGKMYDAIDESVDTTLADGSDDESYDDKDDSRMLDGRAH